MKTFIAAIAISICGILATAHADEVLKTHPDSREWEPLFGADLSKAVFSTNAWFWNKGVLSSQNKDEPIWSKNQYENFILDFKFNLEPGANSGVWLYETDLKNVIPNMIEIQIQDDASPKWAKVAPTWRCGAVFGHSVPKKLAVKKPGEWNRMTIRCEGPKVSVLLNGELVTDINMKDWKSGKRNPDGSDIPPWQPRPLSEMATKGFIGLQGAHGGIPTHFRNIKIKSL
jgi:hypothetical protein